MYKYKYAFKKFFENKKMKGVENMENTNAFQIKYSQNFLRSPKSVEKLVNKSDIGLDDIVYEIGPGKSIITEQLAKKCAK